MFLGRGLAFLLLLSLPACATFSGAPGSSLTERIDAVVDSPPLHQVHWGVLIIDADDGKVLYERNSHRKFVPASNMKILSTAAALSILGPQFRYETGLWGVGIYEQNDGLLGGDLVLHPSGDPTLSERFYPSPTAPLDSIADDLWKAGLRTVTGSLVVDVSRWDSTTVPESWMVGNLPGTSAATGGAFAIGEGVMTVEVVAGPEEGAPARARWWPDTEKDIFTAAFRTAHPDSSTSREAHYRPESRRLRVEGRVPAGEVDTLSVSQRNPVEIASAALMSALVRRGIEVRGGLRIAWAEGEPIGSGSCTTGRPVVVEGEAGRPVPTPKNLAACPEASLLASLTSPPLSEIVEAILEPSQNWMTEQLVHTLGAERGERGSWEEGFRIEQEFFTEKVGVDSLDLVYRDGSGLAAYNLVTPRALVEILRYMRESENADLYRKAMAEPGEEEGTLRRRLAGLEGRVFAKTGTITHVNSLSGYLVTDAGRELIFSILTNGSGLPSGIVRRGIDGVVETVARF
ncbi:D-alanyl-D-alanine carboxypeptidase/D-alanyl-D-alanine-endopeptidase [Gemmatimonadota bacterium]